MPLLEVTDVSKSFGGVRAVNGVSFSVSQGDVLGIMGQNGSGKSTLLNLIAGALGPDRGRIELDGPDIAGRAAHEVCGEGIARTFQLVRPFMGLSVEDNVLVGHYYGRRHRRHASPHVAAADLLERVGLGGKAHLLPGQLTVMDRKRVELARALAASPRLLLLDEFLGTDAGRDGGRHGLDPGTPARRAHADHGGAHRLGAARSLATGLRSERGREDRRRGARGRRGGRDGNRRASGDQRHCLLADRYYLALSLAVIATLTVALLGRSRAGLGMRAIREDEDAAEASGVQALWLKLMALMLSTGIAGLAGGLFAYYHISYYPQHPFAPNWTFDALLITYIGAWGRCSGPS